MGIRLKRSSQATYLGPLLLQAIMFSKKIHSSHKAPYKQTALLLPTGKEHRRKGGGQKLVRLKYVHLILEEDHAPHNRGGLRVKKRNVPHIIEED